MNRPQDHDTKVRRRAWLAGGALVIVAVAFAGFSGWSWWTASHDEARSLQQLRDNVRQAGQREIAALNTMDPAHLDEGLQRWLQASTGTLHDQLRSSEAQSRQQVEQAKSSAVGTVTDAAVTRLDQRAGTASMIAAVDIQVTPQSGSATTERNRYRAELALTVDGWKLRSLTAIPVSGS